MYFVNFSGNYKNDKEFLIKELFNDKSSVATWHHQMVLRLH